MVSRYLNARQYPVFATVLVVFVSLTMADSAAQPTDTSEAPLHPEHFDLQGHRGARGLLPENTVPAFRRALEIGVTTLEMDVVIAGDGTVVVSHEPWMAREKCRTPDGDRIPSGEERSHNVYRMEYGEIEAYDCGVLTLSNFPEQEPTSAAKPRLSEVIQMAESYVEHHDRSPVFYNIETKSRPEWEGTFQPDPETFARRVLEVVDAEDVARRTIVQSFDPRTTREASQRNDRIRTALLVSTLEEGSLADTLTALSFEPDVFSPNAQLVDEDLVGAVHDRGMTLVPWTINDPGEMKRLIGLGIDGLITDYPNRGRDVLETLDVPF